MKTGTLTKKDQARVDKIQARMAEIDNLLDSNASGSLTEQYNERWEAEVAPVQNKLNDWLDTETEALHDEQAALKDSLRDILPGGRIPNARSLNPVSRDEAILGAMAHLESNGFEGKIGPKSIGPAMRAIGYRSTSENLSAQISQGLAVLTESKSVKQLGRGSYQLLSKGRKAGEAAIATIANPPADDESES